MLGWLVRLLSKRPKVVPEVMAERFTLCTKEGIPLAILGRDGETVLFSFFVASPFSTLPVPETVLGVKEDGGFFHIGMPGELRFDSSRWGTVQREQFEDMRRKVADLDNAWKRFLAQLHMESERET